MFRQFLQKFKKSYKSLATLIKENSPKYPYRILSIDKDENDDFSAEVQLIGRRQTFRMKPEEILANDSLTDSFSQHDIRTLTYLGYLSLNSPKYKILAQYLSENDSKLIFAIKERGKQKPIIKSANEISSDKKLLEGLQQKDAHMIGYTIATEQVISEKMQKQELLTAIALSNPEKLDK
jgi:nucleoside-triphosphatase THEP1